MSKDKSQRTSWWAYASDCPDGLQSQGEPWSGKPDSLEMGCLSICCPLCSSKSTLPLHSPCCHCCAQTRPTWYLCNRTTEAVPSLRSHSYSHYRPPWSQSKLLGTSRTSVRPHSAYRGYIRPSSHQPRPHTGKVACVRGISCLGHILG